MTEIAQPVRPKPYYEFRLERLPYFLWSVAALFVMTLLIKLTTELIFQTGGWDDNWDLSMRVLLLQLLIYMVAYFLLALGRFHDIGLSGWWSLLLLVPIVNLVVWLYLFFKPGAVRDHVLVHRLTAPARSEAGAQPISQGARVEPPRAERVATMTNARGWMIFAGLIISLLLVASAVVLFATYYVAA